MKRKFSVMFLLTSIMLFVYTLSLTVPFIWTLISSFKGNIDFSVNPFGLPRKWLFSNYVTALLEFKVPINVGAGRDANFVEMLMWSLLYSIGCTVTNTLTTCTVAYVCAKYRCRFNKVLYGIVIVTMIIPIVGSLPSELQLARFLGLYDNLFGMYILKANFLGMNFLIFYAAFKTLPWSYAEAGFMDGASHFRVMVNLMFPIIRPTILIVGMLAFIGFWNDYQIPMIYLPSFPTAAYGLYSFQLSSETGISIPPMRLAACMIVFAPIFVLFMFTKKYLIGNLTVGGIKG